MTPSDRVEMKWRQHAKDEFLREVGFESMADYTAATRAQWWINRIHRALRSLPKNRY